MKRLSEEEVEVIKEFCYERGKVYAIAAYGSKVAGYAKPGSDYDILVAIEKPKEKVRYVYENCKGLNLSMLLVDEKALIKDAEKAELGEFVVGRLLNPYLPLVNEEYWRRVEVAFKKRVIKEELGELADEFKEMALYLKIPLKYFLFSKLKKRATIYPPALYSYAMTYSGPRGKDNLRSTLEGFKEATKDLISEGLIEEEGDAYRLTEKGLSILKSPFFKRKVIQIERGIKQYLVHGIAGKVGFDVVLKETYSKISRASRFYELPRDLREPKLSLSLIEGDLVFKEGWLEKLGESLGLSKYFKVEVRPMGSFFSTTYLYKLRDRGKEEKVVVKKFLDFWSIKWIIVGMIAKPIRPFGVKPMTRLEKEYAACIELRKAGILTPKILLVSLRDRVLVKEYVEGKSLSDFLKLFFSKGEGVDEISAFVQTLSHAHKIGFGIGDTKPENVIITKGKPLLVDLEQAERGGDPSWDVAEFLYYSCWYAPSKDKAEKLAKLFVKKYFYDEEVLRNAAKEKYVLPFRTIAPDNMIEAIREVLRSV